MSLPEDNDRHAVYLARLTSGLLNAKVYPSMDAAYRAVRAMLLDAEEITSQKQLMKVLDASGKIIELEIGKGMDALTEGLESMAVYEAGFYASLLSSYSGVEITAPGKKAVLSWINQSIMTLQQGQTVQAGVWAKWVNGNISKNAELVNGAIVSGYQNGRTVNQMARDIKDLFNGILKGHAEALARTGQAHYATNAREAMARANSAVKYRVYSAIFDNRTTLGCRALHGRVWEIDDESYVRLPRHFNCRSEYLLVTDPKDAERGTQAAIGGKPAEKINPNRKLKYRGKRDTDIFKPGQIGAGITQDAWLRDQPEWFIESSLGKTRAKLFKDGKMNIKKFTDMTGEPLTLDELRQLDAKAFERAGL